MERGPTFSMPDEHDERTPVPSSVREALFKLTNEIHSNTHAVGRVLAEVGEQNGRLTAVEVTVRAIDTAMRGFRSRLRSIPAEAEDTARHEIEQLRAELARSEQQKHMAQLSEENARLKRSQQEVEAYAKERRKTWERRLWAVAMIAMGFIVRHVMTILGWGH